MLLICFIIFLLVWFPLQVYFFETKSLPLFGLWLKLFYKIEVIGLDNFPEKGPCLLACNHYSFLDWLIVMKLLPRHVHFVIDNEYYEAPGLKIILKKAGAIPIASGVDKPKLLKKAFEIIGENLNSNKVVLIFPEGGITRTGKVQKFRKGIVRIKSNTTAPVIPISIDGLWGSFFSFSKPGLFSFKKLKFARRKVSLRIYPEYKDIEKLDGLKEVIFSGVKLEDHSYTLT